MYFLPLFQIFIFNVSAASNQATVETKTVDVFDITEEDFNEAKNDKEALIELSVGMLQDLFQKVNELKRFKHLCSPQLCRFNNYMDKLNEIVADIDRQVFYLSKRRGKYCFRYEDDLVKHDPAFANYTEEKFISFFSEEFLEMVNNHLKSFKSIYGDIETIIESEPSIQNRDAEPCTFPEFDDISISDKKIKTIYVNYVDFVYLSTVFVDEIIRIKNVIQEEKRSISFKKSCYMKRVEKDRNGKPETVDSNLSLNDEDEQSDGYDEEETSERGVVDNDIVEDGQKSEGYGSDESGTSVETEKEDEKGPLQDEDTSPTGDEDAQDDIANDDEMKDDENDIPVDNGAIVKDEGLDDKKGTNNDLKGEKKTIGSNKKAEAKSKKDGEWSKTKKILIYGSIGVLVVSFIVGLILLAKSKNLF